MSDVFSLVLATRKIILYFLMPLTIQNGGYVFLIRSKMIITSMPLRKEFQHVLNVTHFKRPTYQTSN